MNFDSIVGWASIISLLLGIVSICFSTYSLKKVNKFTDKSKEINRNKVRVSGTHNTVSGRDYNAK